MIRKPFNLEKLLDKIGESEDLVSSIQKLSPGIEQTLQIYRWAIVADEATALIMQAKEELDTPLLGMTKDIVEDAYPGKWEVYEQNPRRWKQLEGYELFEIWEKRS